MTFIILFVVIFAFAYIKKPFTCSAQIKRVETMVRDLPFVSKSIKLSKPEYINSSHGITYCETTGIIKSGKTIKIPYRFKKENGGISIQIDTYDIYMNMIANSINNI